MIDDELKKYIEENIFPSYEKNDEGHRIDHIKYVIDRSLRFASSVHGINMNMVYVIASYHDIGAYIDRKNHEKVSGEILFVDDNLRKFFTEEEMIIMKEAVEDHRASLEYPPRSIYGKIVSSADRNIDVDVILRRTFAYRKELLHETSLDTIIEESRRHVLDKFGAEGYASKKMYFPDPDYDEYLTELDRLGNDKEEFVKRYKLANGLS